MENGPMAMSVPSIKTIIFLDFVLRTVAFNIYAKLSPTAGSQ
tara:strand:- start:3002 stop:3127 length:126 start_codon:yes stop_codon:yes gene_type:complete